MSEAKPGKVKYKNPPLIEAVCEIRFAEAGVPASLIPGRYYEKIKGEYPTIEARRGIGIQTEGEQLAMTTEGVAVFRNPSANRLVQIGQGMIAINQLPPYSDYAAFRREIEARLADYRAAVEPKKLKRIGLRYINRLTIPDSQGMDAVLNIGFKIPKGFPEGPRPYLLRLEFPYQAGRDRLILIITRAPDKEKGIGVMLDLDYVLVRSEHVEETKILEWVDTAHDAIEDAFHKSVTKEALSTFKPIHLQGRGV